MLQLLPQSHQIAKFQPKHNLTLHFAIVNRLIFSKIY